MSSLNLKDQEGLFRQVIEMAPNAMVMIDHNGLIELVNAQVEKIFGYARADLLGQAIDILLPERFRAQHPQLRHSFFNNPSPRSMGGGRDLYGRRQDGSEFPVEIGLNPITTEDGVKVLSSIVDISERKRNEAQLRESDERFRRMIDSVRDYAFIMLDPKGYVTTWNKGAERLKGYREDEIIGRHFSIFYGPDDIKNGMPERELRLADADGQFEEEGWRRRKDGSRFLASVIVSPVRDQKGELRGFVKVTRDITEQKRVEQRLLQLNNDLTRINEELNNFAHVSSHDLKSPLRGIDQLATWIAEDLGDTLNEETRGHLQLMRSRINRMERLLDDLLAYSRVGRSDDALVSVNIADMVRDIFELSAPGKPFQLVLAADLPVIKTRSVPLELVFRNLIGNAIKHHDKPQGCITIASQPYPGGFQFSVSDDGPGIPVEHQQRVFGMFRTLRPRDEIEGSGIGLAVVKKAVESQGGTIRVDSKGNHGCTFHFTWPVAIQNGSDETG